MTTSVYFNTVKARNEQRLYENLAIELIRQYGINIYYLPKTTGNLDELTSEDTTASFQRAFFMEMYVKESYKGFAGPGDFLSMAGAEIDDKITFVVARKVFIKEVGDYIGNQPRPFEGDLIFFPENNKAFRINFVEHESVFYQNGALYVWELQCELFSYGGEKFNTGIPEIDGMTKGFDPNILGLGVLLENSGSLLTESESLPLLTESFVDETDPNILNEKNDYFQREGLKIIDFSEFDPLQGSSTY